MSGMRLKKSSIKNCRLSWKYIFDFYKKLNNDKDIKDEMMQQMFVSLYQRMKGQPRTAQPGML